MPLTDTQCRKLKPKNKAYKVADSGSLYLYIKPSGAKYWRMNYKYHDKWKTLAIGVYPDVSLKAARQARDEAKADLKAGKDPSTEKQKLKLQNAMATSDRFEVIAAEWFEHKKEAISHDYQRQIQRLLKNDIYPIIGKTPIGELTAPELLFALRKIEARGALDIARKARQFSGQIFRYAVAIGKAERDISVDLKGALKTRPVRNRAYLTEAELPAFFASLYCYDGEPLTALALEFIVLTFVRTKELRGARWDEFDLENRLWRVPKERMKMNRPHLVPLSAQAVQCIEHVRRISGNREYVFPNSRSPAKPMSENTMLFGMYRMGYHSKATVHGFRATASTILHENGFNTDVVELQLAHVEQNKVKSAYNHAQHLEERTQMMQWWADHLDSLKIS